jgi:hypothetical protein
MVHVILPIAAFPLPKEFQPMTESGERGDPLSQRRSPHEGGRSFLKEGGALSEEVVLGELYHLRLLLLRIPGPESFEQLREVDGVLCSHSKTLA